jgi:hypothetical protein
VGSAEVGFVVRRSLFVLAATLTLLLSSINPAGAVKFGSPDGNAHPYVGLMVAFGPDAEDSDQDSDRDELIPLWRCSGAMVSTNMFLTAAHCTEAPAVRAQIWFQEKVSQVATYPLSGGVWGTAVPHPNYVGLTVPQTSDVGYVVLDEVYTGDVAYVAPVGTLDDYARGLERGQQAWFTVVGYGLQSVKPVESRIRDRMTGTVQLVNLESALNDGWNIQTTNAPGTGGGTCFGDSGGPIFLQDTMYIVAVNSFVLNENCNGASFGYRVDTQYAHDFIYGG